MERDGRKVPALTNVWKQAKLPTNRLERQGFFMTGRIYQNVTELIGHTPLLEVVNIEKDLGLQARILVKLEYLNPAGSVKDRVARAMIEDARRKRAAKTGCGDHRTYIGKYRDRAGLHCSVKRVPDDSDHARYNE